MLNTGSVFHPVAKSVHVGKLSTPGSPCGPVGPAAPAEPVAPVAPAGPAGPVGPVGPCAPVAPVAPVGPGTGTFVSMIVVEFIPPPEPATVVAPLAMLFTFSNLSKSRINSLNQVTVNSCCKIF